MSVLNILLCIIGGYLAIGIVIFVIGSVIVLFEEPDSKFGRKNSILMISFLIPFWGVLAPRSIRDAFVKIFGKQK